MSATASLQASSSPFKLSSHQCTSCNVSFKTPESRRAHAKSKWHVENLRRRVIGLEPLNPPQGGPLIADHGQDRPASPTSNNSEPSEEEEDDSDDSAEERSENEEVDFNAKKCLFCPHLSDAFDDNVLHMQKGHGMLVPDQGHLIVELETLIRYLHLVIYSYGECVYCQSRRSSVEAVQQHMLGKGHCKLDLSCEDSEFLDFYNFGAKSVPAADGEDVEKEEGASKGSQSKAPKQTGSAAYLPTVEDNQARLPSGKLISHRTAPSAARPSTQGRSPSTEPMQNSRLIKGKTPSHARPRPAGASRGGKALSTALTRSEKREDALTTQLTNLSVKDRSALAHLPVAEQRAVLATQKKQTEKARRAERRYMSRVQMMGNQTLMKHFVSDVPGPKLG